jgi:hypothetical protein
MAYYGISKYVLILNLGFNNYEYLEVGWRIPRKYWCIGIFMSAYGIRTLSKLHLFYCCTLTRFGLGWFGLGYLKYILMAYT